MVLGPSLIPPADAGSVFIRVVDSWSIGPWCSDESDAARAALGYLHNSMFDGSTSFIPHVFRVNGPPDISRTFTLRDGLDDSLDARRQRGRDIVAMAQLGVRAGIPLGRAVARHRHFVMRLPLPVQRSRSGISTEIAAFDELTLNRTSVPPYSFIPIEDSWSTPDGQVWWGLWLATTPPERLRDAFQRLVVRFGERYRSAHPENFMDRIGWELRYRLDTREADHHLAPARKRRRGMAGRGTIIHPPQTHQWVAPSGSVARAPERRDGPITPQIHPSTSAPAGGRGGGAPFGGRGGASWRAASGGRGQGHPVSPPQSVPRS